MEKFFNCVFAEEVLMNLVRLIKNSKGIENWGTLSCNYNVMRKEKVILFNLSGK